MKYPMPRAIECGLAFCACLVLISGCSPARDPSQRLSEALAERDFSVLFRQVVVRVYVIGIRKTAHDDEKISFPYPGFRFENGAIRPATEAALLAGTEMTREEFGAWINQLSQDRTGSILLSTEFLVEPGRSSQASKEVSQTYVANWEFAGNGAGIAQVEELRPGTTLSTRVKEIPGQTALLVRFKLRMRAASTRNTVVIKESESDNGETNPGLNIELPREALQCVTTTAPVRDDHAVILAHLIQQYRRPRSGLRHAENMHRHLLFAVSVRRVGHWPEPEEPAPTVAVPRRYVVNLIWDMPERPLQPAQRQAHGVASPVKRTHLVPLSDKKLRMVFRRQTAGTDAIACALGIAAAEGRSATFEIAEDQSYVEGVSPDPSPDAERPYRFAVRKARTGLRLKTQCVTRGSSVLLTVECRLADPCVLTSNPKRMLSVRQPPSGKRKENYLFSSCIQNVGEGQLEVSAAPGGNWQVRLPWHEEVNGQKQRALSATHRLVLMTLRSADISLTDGHKETPGNAGTAKRP